MLDKLCYILLQYGQVIRKHYNNNVDIYDEM